MRTSELIREGLGHIRNGWCKGAFEDGHGNVCAVASLDRACMNHLTDGGISCYQPAKEKVIKKIKELFGEDNFYAIEQFNDNRDTRKEDVEAAFEKAAIECEEEGD